MSSTVGGSETACFAAEYASRGTRRSARVAGKGSTADNRSDGGWTDSGGAGAAVTPDNATDVQEFRDRSTGLPLDPEMVRKARELEMQYMDELKVLENSNRDECMTETGRAPIPTDWVDIIKGDSLRPNYRSRLVCQETHGRSTIDVEDWAATFAATPPYEAFRLQLSWGRRSMEMMRF